MEYKMLGASHAPLSVHEIEQKLKQLGLLNRLIDVPVENSNDWQALHTCEALFVQIDDQLRAAQVHFSYSKRAGRYLRERYRMMEDGCARDRERGVVPCWTLIDTDANQGKGAPVLVVPPLSPEAAEAARTLGLPPSEPAPAFYRVPMYASEDRVRALGLCERWNIAAAHLCPSCGQRFPEDDLPFEEAPYLNRALLRCPLCRHEQPGHESLLSH